MVLEVMCRSPLDGRFVALVEVKRATDRRNECMQFSLDSVSLGVGMRSQLGFGERYRVLLTMTAAHSYLLM